MTRFQLRADDAVGLVHTFVDAHTLGLQSVAQLLEDCGYRAVVAGEDICRAAQEPEDRRHIAILRRWIYDQDLQHLGFSYRLDPDLGAAAFGRLVAALRTVGILAETGGPIRGLFFAGLPKACERVRLDHGDRVRVFQGEENAQSTLGRLGVPSERIPRALSQSEAYDEARLAFGRDVLRAELPAKVAPVDRTGYPTYGTRRDTLLARLDHGRTHNLPPLMRAHVGPYHPDREYAVQEYLQWCRRLAASRYLDILSIGTSQLTQSDFGGDWSNRANGGGVPIQTAEEYEAVYEASRNMLVRTYAGTTNIAEMATLHERTLNIAWHALSFWWFSRIDGRGPYSVADNLRHHFDTLRVIAASGKPFEANIPHHFAFRGADDATYVASAILAARCAKRMGVRTFVLQNMLNTPRSTWGIQDLAKARVMLALARELEDRRFRVVYQPRAGLDSFSPDAERAKVQLAAVTALMDEVEPTNPSSPEVIHVVSYSEGFALADPDVVDESIRITRAALDEYRRLRAKGNEPSVTQSLDLASRMAQLAEEVGILLRAMESAIPNLYTPDGLYIAFWAGFLPTPSLWEDREEFAHAVAWRTRPIEGSVRLVDEENQPLSLSDRIQIATANAEELAMAQSGRR